MLSPKQQQVLRFIERFTEQRGIAPGLAEIAEELGVASVPSTRRHLVALKAKGYLDFAPGSKRAYRVLQSADPVREAPGVPLVGTIAAGQPLLAVEAVERIDLNQLFNQEQRCFLLTVKGDSMIDAGIHEGDYVLIDPQKEVRNGVIVVALVDGVDATLKRYHKHGGVITLTPENTTLKPMVFDARRVQVQGVMVGQIRDFR